MPHQKSERLPAVEPLSVRVRCVADLGNQICLRGLEPDDVDAVLSWRYENEYALYDLSPDDRSTLTKSGSTYWAIAQGDDLLGFVCVGIEARVAGMVEDPDLVDLGLGLRPDLTGRGASSDPDARDHRCGRAATRNRLVSGSRCRLEQASPARRRTRGFQSRRGTRERSRNLRRVCPPGTMIGWVGVGPSLDDRCRREASGECRACRRHKRASRRSSIARGRWPARLLCLRPGHVRSWRSMTGA